MTKRNQDFSMFAGDTKDIVVTLTDSAGAAQSLSGASIRWVMKKTVGGQTQVSKQTGSGITLTNTSGGIFTIRLSASDTSGLSGRYCHEAEVTDALGNVSTVMTGHINFERA